VIAVSMDERDIERLMAWPFINICTDGELDGDHPRGFGTFRGSSAATCASGTS